MNTKTKAAFTLIELLVVVLIIGILAAVALPQYQTAVNKSRLAPYINLAKNIRNAQELYYMTHGQYAYKLNDLDIDLDYLTFCQFYGGGGNCMAGCKGHFMIGNEPTGSVLQIVFCPNQADHSTSCTYCKNNYEMLLYFYYSRNPHYPNKIVCQYTTERGKKMCPKNSSISVAP